MAEKTASTPEFTALLGDLEKMAKAIDVNQERIEAGRAAEHKMQSGEELTKSEEAKRKEKDEEERKERERKAREKNAGGEKGEMCKSFTMTAADGSTVEVLDASDMLKALGDRIDGSVDQIFATFKGVTELLGSQGKLIKSLTDKIEAQGTTIGEQGELIKSLKGELDKVGSQGAGRKAVLTLAERTTAASTTTLAKGGLDGITHEVFFAKALDMQRAGKLTGTDIATAEASLNSGVEIPPSILSRVVAEMGRSN